MSMCIKQPKFYISIIYKGSIHNLQKSLSLLDGEYINLIHVEL
jgi:hypothetical protein